MKEALRIIAAGATGAVLSAAVLVGQPALAGVQAKIAPKNSVTSKSIKNGTIQSKDLNADVNGSLGKANSALQSIPDNSITNSKMADNAVGSAEVAADSLGAGVLAANSVGASELAANSVAGGDVQDGGLGLVDISDNQGFVNIDLPSLVNNACTTENFDTGSIILGGLVTVSPSFLLPNGLYVESARTHNGAAAQIDVYVCNHSGGTVDAPSVPFYWGVLG